MMAIQLEAGLGAIGLADLAELDGADILHRLDPVAIAKIRDLEDRLFAGGPKNKTFLQGWNGVQCPLAKRPPLRVVCVKGPAVWVRIVQKRWRGRFFGRWAD